MQSLKRGGDYQRNLENSVKQFTPLSHLIRDEKLSRNRYLTLRGPNKKCKNCGTNWSMPSDGRDFGSTGTGIPDQTLCWTCFKLRSSPVVLVTRKPVAAQRDIWKLVSKKYPELLLPKADQTEEDSIRLLSKALQASENIEVIKFLYARLPNNISATRHPTNGLLPLQIAIISRCDEDVIRFIVFTYPEAAKDLALENTLPALHCMRIGGVRIGIVKMLADAAGRACVKGHLEKMDRGGTPFLCQYVESSTAGRSQLELLISIRGNQCLRTFDAHGKIPIHHACCGGQLIVIETLIRIDPATLLIPDTSKGWLPLQWFIVHSKQYGYLERECLFQAIVELKLYRESAISHKDHEGKSPLHLAIYFAAPVDILEHLLDLQEDLILQDERGYTPLHAALEQPQCSVVFLEQLIRRSPRSTILKTKNGWTAFRVLLHYRPMKIGQIDWAEPERFHLMNVLLTADKGKAARTRDPFEKNAIPLHFVLKQKDKLPTKYALLLVKHGGLNIADTNGYLPLHIASNVGADLSVFQQILDGFPAGASMRNKDGHIPAQLALRQSSGRKIVTLLLSAHMGDRDVVLTANKEDVDCALKRMLDFYPERLVLKDSNGNTSIHWAIERHAEPGIVKEILRAHPSLIGVIGDRMLPPFQLCCALPYSNMTLQHLYILHKFDPNQIKNDIASRYGLHYATISNQPFKVVDFLLDRFKWAIKIRDNSGQVPAYYAMKNKNHEVLNLLLGVYFGPDELIKVANLESIRYAICYPCPLETDALKQTIFHRLCWSDNHSHILRVLAHYRPTLAVELDNNMQSPIDICVQNGALASKFAITEELMRSKIPFTARHRPNNSLTLSQKETEPVIKSRSDDIRSPSLTCLIIVMKQLLKHLPRTGSVDVSSMKPTSKLVGVMLQMLRSSEILPPGCPGLPLFIPTKWMSKRTSKECLVAGIGFLQNGLRKLGPQGHFNLYFLCEAPFVGHTNLDVCSLYPYPCHNDPIHVIRPAGPILDVCPIQVIVIHILKLGLEEWPSLIPTHLSELQGCLVDNLLLDYLDEFYMNSSIHQSDIDIVDTFERIFHPENLRLSYQSILFLKHKFETGTTAVFNIEVSATLSGEPGKGDTEDADTNCRHGIYVCSHHSKGAPNLKEKEVCEDYIYPRVGAKGETLPVDSNVIEKYDEEISQQGTRRTRSSVCVTH